MLQLQYSELKHAFVYPFTIAKGTKSLQDALIVSLRQGMLAGFGEAPAIAYNEVTVSGMMAQLESKRNMLEHYALTEPKRFWHFLHHLLPNQHFLIASLDIAAWDLFSQRSGRPLYKTLGISELLPVLTNYTIGYDDEETMLQKIKTNPWPVYKIKVRSADDLDLLSTLRSCTAAPFRVDANEALSFDDAKKWLPELVKLNVELLEQPLAVGEWDAMRELKEMNLVPLFADESCQTEEDVAKCEIGFDGINIKLTKCGGITPALRMIQLARSKNLKVMLGNMNESNIGTAALLHLSPLVDFVDADGPLLLKDVACENIFYDAGYLHCQPAAGLGERAIF